jgi:hypothetical protein
MVILEEHVQYDTFDAYWDRYSFIRGLHNNHDLVNTLYQNTIDYDATPVFTDALDDIRLFKNDQNVQIDLWPYVEDIDSNDWELNYSAMSSPGCNVYIDENRKLTIGTTIDFVGTCDVIVMVDDGIPLHATSENFQVIVEEPRYIFLLSLYLKLIR